jgi:hypothetical protein
MREYPVRICEGLGVKFPGPTRQSRPKRDVRSTSAFPLIATEERTWPEVAACSTSSGVGASTTTRISRCGNALRKAFTRWTQGRSGEMSSLTPIRTRHPWYVIALALALSAFSAGYTERHFAIKTDDANNR